MASMEAWLDFCKRTEVLEKNGKFYLRNSPERLFDTYEEAKKLSEGLRNLILF